MFSHHALSTAWPWKMPNTPKVAPRTCYAHGEESRTERGPTAAGAALPARSAAQHRRRAATPAAKTDQPSIAADRPRPRPRHQAQQITPPTLDSSSAQGRHADPSHRHHPAQLIHRPRTPPRPARAPAPIDADTAQAHAPHSAQGARRTCQRRHTTIYPATDDSPPGHPQTIQQLNRNRTTRSPRQKSRKFLILPLDNQENI